MSLYHETVPQMSKMLASLDTWLQEAVDFAAARDFDPELLLEARLFPDQFTLRRQIQSACDTAKFVGVRLIEAKAPVHDDGPQTLAELRSRIADVQAYLASLDADAFTGIDDKELSIAFLKGMKITAADFTRQFSLPNFYFHLVTAYSILRNNGVKLGKMKYIGSLNLIAPS